MVGESAWLTIGAQHRILRVATVLVGGIYASRALGWLTVPSMAVLVVGGVLFFWVLVLADPEPLETSMQRVGAATVSAVYGGLLLVFLYRLRNLSYGEGWAAMALFCTWGADTAAYLAGRWWGRHKLYPKVSPGKTVEGLGGSVVGATLVVFLARAVFVVPVPLSHTLALGLIAGLVGVVGDLAESLLKRSVGAKDSSHLIPGHGGVLDRFDAVLFVSPAMYYYLVWVAGVR
jgi:phosphatidate cytidylyltransferase